MPKKRVKKKKKRIVDNKMQGFGDFDPNTGQIRINKKRSKSPEGRKKGGVIDSIKHEENHRIHPRMGERAIIKKTKRDVKKMSRYQKAVIYSRYK